MHAIKSFWKSYVLKVITISGYLSDFIRKTIRIPKITFYLYGFADSDR